VFSLQYGLNILSIIQMNFDLKGLKFIRLSPCDTALLANLLVAHLVTVFAVFNGTQKLVTVLPIIHHKSYPEPAESNTHSLYLVKPLLRLSCVP
jgi:hypothetical protein